MALLDLSALMTDPDFADAIQIITRSAAANSYGENVLTELAPLNAIAVVQGGNTETLARLPDGARLADVITVYYAGVLTVESLNGYADIIVWRGKRYIAHAIVEDFSNYGAGFTVADCILEAVNNNA